MQQQRPRGSCASAKRGYHRGLTRSGSPSPGPPRHQCSPKKRYAAVICFERVHKAGHVSRSTIDQQGEILHLEEVIANAPKVIALAPSYLDESIGNRDQASIWERQSSSPKAFFPISYMEGGHVPVCSRSACRSAPHGSNRRRLRRRVRKRPFLLVQGPEFLGVHDTCHGNTQLRGGENISQDVTCLLTVFWGPVFLIFKVKYAPPTMPFQGKQPKLQEGDTIKTSSSSLPNEACQPSFEKRVALLCYYDATHPVASNHASAYCPLGPEDSMLGLAI
jgi:hypothetical protein